MKHMKNKERYYNALIQNQGHINEIDLGEKIQLNEIETREIIAQLLAEHRIAYEVNRNCNYKVVNKNSYR